MRIAFGLVAFALTGCLLLTSHDDRLWACTSNSDCSDGETCRHFLKASACAPPGPGYCVTDDDCQPGPNPHCTNGRCACTSSQDCDNGYSAYAGGPPIEVCGADGYCKIP